MPKVPPRSIEIDGARVAELVARRDAAVREAEDIRQELISMFGGTAENAIIAGSGGLIAMTYKPQRRPRFDLTKFREQHPELADQFTRMDTSFVLLPKRKTLGLKDSEDD